MAEEQTTGTEYMTVQDFTNALQNIKSYIDNYITDPKVKTEYITEVIERVQPEISGSFRYMGSADSSKSDESVGAFPDPVPSAYGHAYLDVAQRTVGETIVPANQFGICLPTKPGVSSSAMEPRWHRILTMPSGGDDEYMIDPFPGASSSEKIEVTTKSIVDRINQLTTTISALSASVAKVYQSFCNEANPWFTADSPADIAHPYYGQVAMSGDGPVMWVPTTGSPPGEWVEIQCKCEGTQYFWKHFDSSDNASAWAYESESNAGTYVDNDNVLKVYLHGRANPIAISNQWMTGGDATTCNGTAIKILASNDSQNGVTITAWTPS